jgi:peptidoglycan/LPS O-acetylase OafA/YrhL
MRRSSISGACSNGASPVVRYYGWIDPLRGFAAISVLLYHLAELAALQLPESWPGAWFRVGFLGVDLFFAISGAVIVTSLASLQQRHGSEWRWQFWSRRLARIVPLYLLTSLAFVLLVQPEIMHRSDWGWVLAAQLSFTHNLFASTHGAINGPSWTLGVEMQFYLLMVVFGGAMLRMRLLPLALLGITLMAAWRLWIWSRYAVDEPASMFRLATQLPGVFDTFVAGMIAARWQMLRVGRDARAPMGLMLSIAALFAWIVGIALMYVAAAAGGYWTHPLGLIVSHLAISIAAGLTVAAAMELPAARRSVPGLRATGDLSYGIYLWHLPVILLTAALALTPGWNALLVVATTVMLAAAGWWLVERPVIARVRRGRGRGVLQAAAAEAV